MIEMNVRKIGIHPFPIRSINGKAIEEAIRNITNNGNTIYLKKSSVNK
jgi:hypothetical protein